MTPEELIALTEKEILSRFGSRDVNGHIIVEHADGQYALSGRPTCSDCYYNSLGKIIEASPYLIQQKR
ncbi:MAG: hypothetical protein AABW79_03895 [Nanoarchaeota archaeon]